jgi:hypothetical protein
MIRTEELAANLDRIHLEEFYQEKKHDPCLLKGETISNETTATEEAEEQRLRQELEQIRNYTLLFKRANELLLMLKEEMTVNRCACFS